MTDDAARARDPLEKAVDRATHEREVRAAEARGRAAGIEDQTKLLSPFVKHYGYCATNRWPDKGNTFGKCNCGLDRALASKEPPT